MTWREVQEADLEECLAIDPRSTGESIVGRQSALKIWKELFRNRAFNCALIQSETTSSPSEIVSFGASVFIRSEYADRELQNPRPNINSRIFASIAAGEPALRSEGSLVSQKEADGLDLVLLCSSFSLAGLSPEEQVEAGILLPKALVHLHVGYRIKRIVMETTNERMRLLAAASGVWRTVANFPTHDRALFVVTREEGLGLAGFGLLGPLFHHKTPILRLRETEKQLLCQAVHGETDAELAASLNLSISSIKKRWTALFARIAQSHPKLLPENELYSEKEGRGSQKRHRVLAYIREHPEEVRPFRSYPG